MILAGLQKSTLIDYPGKIACVVFTTGCNLRCGFCHNPEMVLPNRIQSSRDTHISEKLFFNFLDRRIGLLDGVSICGGEPTIHPDLPDFCRKIKDKGFLVKLDTNGQNPDMIARLIDEHLVDYIAMDIKHTWEKYSSLVGVPFEKEKYEKSIFLIIHGTKNYEFRSTLIEGIHIEADIREMSSYIAGAKSYYLQNYQNGITLDPLFQGNSLSLSELEYFRDIASKNIEKCEIRI